MKELSKLLLMEELDSSYTDIERLNKSSNLDIESEKLLSEITKKMLESNAQFFDSLCSDNRGVLSRLFDFTISKENIELDMAKVRRANLESFIPLKCSEAMSLWLSLQEESNTTNFKKQLRLLHDSGSLIVEGDNIYPISLFSLFQSRNSLQ